MNTPSKRLQALQPSATLAMSQKSAELKSQGVDVINLSVGEPDFMTPTHIKEAAEEAIHHNYTHYTPVAGYMSLREAVSQKLKRENNLDFPPEQVVVGNGAKQELCNVLLATVNPGDEVIIPTPAWVSYVQMVVLCGGKPVLVTAGMEQDFKISPEQLEQAITPATKAIIICSPSNPSGSVYSRDELDALAQVLKRHEHVLVVSDEIYEHINYVGSHASIAQCEGLKDRVAIINGVSKAYAMTGWRIGYVAGPLWLTKAVTKLQGQYTSGASSIAQKAAEEALNGSQKCVEQMRDAFLRRRDLMLRLLDDIPGLELNAPQGAFYLFPKVSSFFGKSFGDTAVNDANDLAMYLLNEAHVATVAGDAFECPGYLRLSYAASDEQLVVACARLKAALAKLK